MRRAGLPIGPGTALDAIRAAEAGGIGRREDFYRTLHAVFVTRRSQRELFDQAFHMFWRKPAFLEQMMSMLMPEIARSGEEERPKAGRKRLARALFEGHNFEPPERERDSDIDMDATITFSDREVLRQMDFEQMTP